MLKKFISGFSIHSSLILVSLLSIFPFVWLLSTSFKGVNEDIFAYPPVRLPQDFTFANYIEFW
jgi:ABC-type glycerol-3-phosphate transport system permease component